MNISEILRFFDMSFAVIAKDLQKELKSNLPQFRFLLKKSEAIAY